MTSDERYGPSAEAEGRHKPDAAVHSHDRVKLGSLLAEIGREARLTQAEWSTFEEAALRSKTPADPIPFGST